MFGYIRIAKSELRVKEYEMYKAVYCSLCRHLGKSFGVFSRFTLSYDFTFLALLNMALQDGCDPIKRRRCVCNPFKKCNYCRSDAALQMPADAAMILLYYKILDNIADEKGIKRLGFWLLKPMFYSAWKKASRRRPEIADAVKEYTDRQSALEKAGCTSLDEAADPTADVLSKIFSMCSDDEAQKRVLSRLGYCIGRYIYVLDAACDLQDDRKNGTYNVFKAEPEFSLERAQEQLILCINEAILAFELLELKKYKSILGNILYVGLEEIMKKELAK